MEIQYNHPATKLVNQLNINIITGGYAAADHSWIGRSVCSPYSRLYYIDEGSGFLRYHGTEISLSPGHVYLIPAGLLFHYGCEKRVCQLYFHINIFTPNGFDLLRQANECAYLPIPLEKIQKIKAYFAGSELSDALMLKQEIYRSAALLIQKLGLEKPGDFSYSPEILASVAYIRQNLSIQLNAAALARRLFISESTFSKRFKAEVGMTPGKYIDELIFFRAEYLLTKTNKTIREISEELGFCDQFYFSRRFTRRYEETPLSYRTRMKSNSTI